MKDAKTIIEHIYDYPLLSKNLRRANECHELVSLFPKAHQNLIAFCYVRENTLFFALKHPLGLSELKRDSSIFMIKGLLKTIISSRKDSIFTHIKEIKFFVTKLLKFKEQEHYRTIYRPKSKGEFINLCKDSEFYTKFEELREILKRRNERFDAIR
ncbi:hypothetical protein KDE13_04260 [Campylobacter sp. faydin G-140]|uniref:hypothetical protein n=1 Tax=Campylobacter anatolicus TaxID=2829105 RepID=UPI001B9BFE74|nr:hypothetical protein [Campylobacter anatolicus]MBR8462446.1 hypothetical protein [Campylobacter anatolicus]MBR8465574.1 hypothetical protein [Campylobacter anatolicus]